MDRRAIGMTLLIAGVAIASGSLILDYVGLGIERGIGWKQTVGVILGILISATGVIVRKGFPRE